MNNKILSAVLIIVFMASMLSVLPIKVTAPQAVNDDNVEGVYTPNIERLIASAINRGLLPAEPTDDQITNYLQVYFAQKLIKPYEYTDPKMAERIGLRESGQDIGVDPEIDPTGVAEMLVLIVEFTGTQADDPGSPFDGPLHNHIPAPGPRDNTMFWIPDFNPAHYQSMLFDPTPGVLSMHNYYLEQSYGQFTVDGSAFGWVQIQHTEWWYGADDPAGGHDNLNGPRYRIVKDAIDAANAQATIPWADFDTNNDGWVDHFAIVHSGEDQAAGGGAQGDNAIWSVSSSYPGGYFTGAYNANNMPIYAGDFTVMPENGNLGVFSHEFGHDIGLPDTYDTIYSGDSSPAAWDLMAMGSWLGVPGGPLDTMPSHITIWGKMAMGWISPGLGNMKRYSLSQLSSGKTLKIDQVETTGGIKAVIVDLPSRVFYMNTPYSGSYEWWGGRADLIDYTLTRAVDLSGKTTATLGFWTWYEIETGWDFGIVQVSTDGGATWTSLSDNEGRTTSAHDPNAMGSIVANLPGLTGSSGGWIHETYNLPTGSPILLRFRYMTDWGTTFDGWFLDEIEVNADGARIFYDNVETLDPGWIVSGWTRSDGRRTVAHYYIMEWRNFVGFDLSLTNMYNYPSNADLAAGYAERYSYNPGLLLWYRNMGYVDNWVGVHPGRGFLLVVDSHPQPTKRTVQGDTWPTRVQVRDATFSLQRTFPTTLTWLGVTRTYASLNGEPKFDDSQSYYNPAVEPKWVQSASYPYNIFRYPFQADAGTIVPTYGLKLSVTSQATDNTWANLYLGWLTSSSYRGGGGKISLQSESAM